MLALVTAGCAGAGASSLAAQTGFDGVITFRQDRDGKLSTFVQTTKGRKVRLDGFGSDSGSVIVDGDAKVIMMVQPRQKKYLVMTEEDAKQMAAMMGPVAERMKAEHSETEPGSISFANTGRKETVAGVSCEVWHGTYSGGQKAGKQQGDACLAQGVGFALAEIIDAVPVMKRGQPGWGQMEQYRELTAGGKGILKASTTADGKATTELEATKIEPKVVSDDAFKPPAGFQEIRVGEMMMNAMKQMQEKMKQKQAKP